MHRERTPRPAGSTGRRYTDEDRAEAQRLKDAGWTHRQLCEKFGVSKSTLSYWLNEASREAHLKRNATRKALGHSSSRPRPPWRCPVALP